MRRMYYMDVISAGGNLWTLWILFIKTCLHLCWFWNPPLCLAFAGWNATRWQIRRETTEGRMLCSMAKIGLWEDTVYFQPSQTGTKLQKEQTTKTYKSHQFAHQFGAGQHVLIMYHENRLWKATSFGKKSQKLCCWCLVHSNSVPPARSPSLAGAYTTWTNQGTLFVLVWCLFVGSQGSCSCQKWDMQTPMVLLYWCIKVLGFLLCVI